MKITAELRAQARMIADAPEGAEIQELARQETEWGEPISGTVVLACDRFVYRLKPEPRTIYVNEYNGYGYAYHSKQIAIDTAGTCGQQTAIRLAVEYREVVK